MSRKLNGEATALLFMKRIIRQLPLMNYFPISKIEQIISENEKYLDVFESNDPSVDDIIKLLKSSKKSTDILSKNLTTSNFLIQMIEKIVITHETFLKLSIADKKEVLKALISFIARIVRIKMLCVFESLSLDSQNFQDLCFKEEFISITKKQLSKRLRIILGGIFAYDYKLKLNEAKQTIIEQRKASSSHDINSN